MKHLLLLVLPILLVLGGCTLSDRIPLLKKSTAERQLAELRVESQQKVDAKEVEVAKAKDAVIAGLNKQLDGAADSFYGTGLVLDTLKPFESRPIVIISNLTQEGIVAIGGRQPSYQAMQTMNKRIKDELDATKTSLADLQRNHTAAMSENQKLADATKAAEAKVAAAVLEMDTLKVEYQAKIGAKTDEVLKLSNQIVALEKQRADDAVARRAMLTKMSSVLGVLALASIAISVYFPLAKSKAAICAVIFGGLAIGIWYVQPWHLAVVAGAALLGVAIWMIWQNNRDNKTLTGVVRGVQAFKDKAGDVYEKELGPLIRDRLGRYTKDGKVVPDTSLEAHVDQVLMKAGDK